MRRVLVFLMLLAFVVPVAPAAPETCEMGCAKTSACCCAKRAPQAGEARLSAPSNPCCRSASVPVVATAAAILPAGHGHELPSLDLPLPSSAAAPRASTPRPAGPPRAPPLPPVAI